MFGRLALRPSTAARAAEEAGGDARAFRILLDALTALGLLAKRGQTYVNTEDADRYLVPGRPDYAGDQLVVDDLCWDMWGRLEETLLHGEPAVGDSVFQEGQGDEVAERLLRGLHRDAVLIAPALAKALPLAEHGAVLDVGGGAGAYALSFARDYPHLRASIFELPKAAALARENVEAWGLADRVAVVEGDFLRVELPPGHDFIFMSNILHGQPPEENAALFHRVARAAPPGGRVAVRDVIMEPGLAGPEFGAVFAVNMLLHTRGGRCYALREITDWMTAAGLEDIHHDAPNSLILARKPA